VLGEQDRRMAGEHSSAVSDLRSTRHPRRDNQRSEAAGFPDFGKQAHLSDLHRKRIVLALVAERAGHAAAAGRGFYSHSQGGQHLKQRRRSDQGLGVTMIVYQDRLPRRPQAKPAQSHLPTGITFEHELFEQAGRPGDGQRLRVIREEFDVLVAQGQQARRFETDDLQPGLGERRQSVDVPPGLGSGLGQQPLGDHRAAATPCPGHGPPGSRRPA
jgi:hypothetical protein